MYLGKSANNKYQWTMNNVMSLCSMDASARSNIAVKRQKLNEKIRQILNEIIYFRHNQNRTMWCWTKKWNEIWLHFIPIRCTEWTKDYFLNDMGNIVSAACRLIPRICAGTGLSTSFSLILSIWYTIMFRIWDGSILTSIKIQGVEQVEVTRVKTNEINVEYCIFINHKS